MQWTHQGGEDESLESDSGQQQQRPSPATRLDQEAYDRGERDGTEALPDGCNPDSQGTLLGKVVLDGHNTRDRDEGQPDR